MQLGTSPMQSVELKASLPGIPCSLCITTLCSRTPEVRLGPPGQVGNEQPLPLWKLEWLQQGISDGVLCPESCSGAACPGPGLSAEPPRLLQGDKRWLWANKPSSPGRAAWHSTSTCPSRGATGPVYGGRPRGLRMKWTDKQRD